MNKLYYLVRNLYKNPDNSEECESAANYMKRKKAWHFLPALD